MKNGQFVAGGIASTYRYRERYASGSSRPVFSATGGSWAYDQPPWFENGAWHVRGACNFTGSISQWTGWVIMLKIPLRSGSYKAYICADYTWSTQSAYVAQYTGAADFVPCGGPYFYDSYPDISQCPVGWSNGISVNKTANEWSTSYGFRTNGCEHNTRSNWSLGEIAVTSIWVEYS